jgi:flagellar hook-associated protein 3 FlgL
MIAAELSVAATFSQNATTTDGLMQVTSNALSSLITEMQSAISTAVSGNNGTLNPSNEQSIAQELQGIQSTILSLANTSYQGVSIFAGSQSTATAFTIDSSTSPATVQYNGDGDVLTIGTPSGGSLQTAIPGDQIFGGGSGTTANVLGVLNNLITDFSTGASAVADTAALSASFDQVTAIQAQYGASMQQLQSLNTYSQSQQTQLQIAQTSLVGVNFAQVATQLSNVETQQSALLSVMASAEKSNDLFDYLN